MTTNDEKWLFFPAKQQRTSHRGPSKEWQTFLPVQRLHIICRYLFTYDCNPVLRTSNETVASSLVHVFERVARTQLILSFYRAQCKHVIRWTKNSLQTFKYNSTPRIRLKSPNVAFVEYTKRQSELWLENILGRYRSQSDYSILRVFNLSRDETNCKYLSFSFTTKQTNVSVFVRRTVKFDSNENFPFDSNENEMKFPKSGHLIVNVCSYRGRSIPS